MLKIPNRIHLANLPTRIEKLDKFTKVLEGPEIFIKEMTRQAPSFQAIK